MALSALDQRVTAAISGLELPFVLETLIMPFGCIHGYAGGIIGMPALWISATVALGMWESPGVGRMGFFFYMYTAATGQCISGTLKILLNRTRPGMDGASAAQPLPNRHWLPGSPAFIRQFPMEQLLVRHFLYSPLKSPCFFRFPPNQTRNKWQPSPLVKIGGLQHGVTKGLNGSESGAFPSGDAMAGACFAALLAGFTPIGIWGGIFYAHLTM